jgi:predicted ATPase with chaperone activity
VKLARTIADLDSGTDAITAAQVGEAVMLRCLDRERLISACS